MRDKLVQSMFVQAIKNNEDSIALHMSLTFGSLLLRCTAVVVPPILAKIQKDPSQFNEIQLSLLQRLQPKFHFKHAFLFVQLLEDTKSSIFKAYGNLLLMSNPLMVLVLTTDILCKLKK